MDVHSACRLPVASLLWRPSADAWALTVVCKATFTWSGSTLSLAEHQEPPTPADLHWDDDERRSLRAASDLVPIKPRVDVVLVGHAYAPDAAPVSRLSARLAVGAIDKTIELVGGPNAGRSSQPGSDEGTFTEMPLVYERALGSSAANPVGVMPDAQEPGARQANLYLQHSALASAASPASASFGPVASSWPERRRKLGAQAASWSAAELCARSLPADLDLSYFNHAPTDQQLDHLPDGARVVLEHLDRDAPLLELSLPPLRPWLTVEREGSLVDEATAEELPSMRCDTLTIDTDRSMMTLVWRAQVALERPDEAGRAIVSLDPLGTSLVAQAARRRSMPAPPASTWPKADATGLPFRKPSGAEPAAAAPASRSWPSRPPPASTAGPASVPVPVPPAVPVAVPAAAPVAVPAAVPPAATPVAPPWVAPRASYRPPAEPSVELRASPWVPPEQRSAEGALAQTIGQQVAGPPEPVKAKAPSISPEAGSQPRKAAPLERGEVLQLLWFESEAVPRARRVPEHAELLAALEHRAREPELEDAYTSKEPADVEDRRDVFEILARAPALGDERWAAALASATLVGGRYVPPIVLVAGELALCFDELATLRSTVSIATPLIGADEALKRAVQDARDFLALPDLLSPASVVEGFTARIVDAFRKLKRALPASYLEGHAERAVLERRLYQKRELYGANHLRAALHFAGSTRPVPAYLPEALAPKLPLYPRFRARLLAELHLSEDPLDAHEASLRVVALGRIVSLAQDAQSASPR